MFIINHITKLSLVALLSIVYSNDPHSLNYVVHILVQLVHYKYMSGNLGYYRQI